MRISDLESEATRRRAKESMCLLGTGEVPAGIGSRTIERKIPIDPSTQFEINRRSGTHREMRVDERNRVYPSLAEKRAENTAREKNARGDRISGVNTVRKVLCGSFLNKLPLPERVNQY